MAHHLAAPPGVLPLPLLRAVHAVQRIQRQAQRHPHPKAHIGQPAQAANQVNLGQGGKAAKTQESGGMGRGRRQHAGATIFAAALYKHDFRPGTLLLSHREQDAEARCCREERHPELLWHMPHGQQVKAAGRQEEEQQEHQDSGPAGVKGKRQAEACRGQGQAGGS